MLTFSAAVVVATDCARREGRSQVIAEAAGRADPERFVIGPSKGWHPRPDRWMIRAKVSDASLELAVLGDWEPPSEPTT